MSGTCLICGGPIIYGVTAGSGVGHKVWTHVRAEDWQASPHAAAPGGTS